MIECSLRCTNKGKAAFKDLPVGSVFRTEEGNDYIFLKIEDACDISFLYVNKSFKFGNISKSINLVFTRS